MLKVQSFNPYPMPVPGQLRKKIEKFSFFLSDKIGKGYSSNVYKGTNDLTNQIVAIKVIQLKSLKDEVTKGLLRIELECMKKVNHPNLLEYIDSYETVNNCYIITQYCEGGDLQKHMRKKGKLSQIELMEIFNQIYDAYVVFSNAGYIHRDLKPANIFLRNNKIKIADFGFVKKASGAIKQSYNVGTPVYMPPQSLNSSIYSQKSDIWSLGVICYQLVHGKVPWQGSNQAQLKNKIQTLKPTFDYNLVSIELQNFILCCLETNPASRMDLKKMGEHPWMQKIRQKFKVEKIFNPMRIPLRDVKNIMSQGSCTNIVSRDCSQKLNILKRNVSINQSLGRQQIQRKKSISERPTMDSLQQQKYKSKPSPTTSKELKKNQKPMQKSAFDSLICIMNLMRFEFKIFKFIQQHAQNEIRKQLLDVIGKHLFQLLHQQQQMIESKKNVYELSGWSTFIESQKWDAYKGVLQLYSQKYNKVQFSEKLTYPSVRELGILIFELHQTVKFQIQDKNLVNLSLERKKTLFRKIESLDYLITLVGLHNLINKGGWHDFILKSPINVIADCRCLVNQENYQQIWEKLSSRVRTIETMQSNNIL